MQRLNLVPRPITGERRHLIQIDDIVRLCIAVSMFVFLAVMFLSTLASGDDTVTSGEQLTDANVLLSRGEAIWKQSCADCHGEQGEGVPGAYEKLLIGDESVGQLTKVIVETMPKDEAETCVGEDAVAVATWIHHTFYSEAARLRNRPARIMLTHLTGNQLQQSLADLYGSFGNSSEREDQHGLTARYYDGTSRKDDTLKIERVDPIINFDWGKESPGEGIESKAYFIRWRGGLKVDETGRYEIIVRSTAAFQMDFGRFGRLFIDNHVQSGDKTEFRKSVTLMAGRVYPLQIDLYQRERKTEQPPVNVMLSWVAPHGVEEVIPQRNLIATTPPATFALQTRLPPDDRSYGYDRGLAVDLAWDESTTQAAVEFASIAISELWPDYQKRHKDDTDENRARLRSFVGEIAEVAFRGPLTEEERQLYVDDQIEATEDDASAVKRCLLTILKSPRFLYPELDRDRSVSQRVANRLALTLFDSLPSDKALREAARNNQLETEEYIRQMAQRMVNDDRCTGKMREMLFEWLNLSRLNDITKDRELYPNFDSTLVADLRSSLNALLDDAVIDADGDFRQLFDADWVYTSPRLAEFYGDLWQTEPNETSDSDDGEENPAEAFIGLQPTNELKRVQAKAPYNHGVLSHPYLMSGLAYSDTTSPIHRGVFLIRYLLGRTLQPPNAAFTPLSPDLHPDLTTRERVQLQTSPETCQVCHSKINQLGFTLETFDAVGRFREKEGQKQIDASGSYIDQNGETVTFTGTDDLAQYLQGSDDAHRAFVGRAFQHFVKQPIAAYGPEKLDELIEKFRAGNFNLQNLLVEIAVIAATPPAPTSPTSNTDS
ncbi:MAG: DUF1592 domain-containing protein [Planctomycetaceae bacterium]|nr:DUF1592 domain-containing protein [Planctomycetaceae bacterium]